MSAALLVIGTLVIGTLIFFTVRAGLRAVTSARRAFSDLRPHPVSVIPARLARLLRQGHVGQFIVISDLATERFVQFRRYGHEPSHYGLSFDFPRAPWSERYYEKLLSRLEDDGTHFVLQPTLEAPVTEFLQVDCGRDVNLATSLVERVLFDIFGIPRDALVRITNGHIKKTSVSPHPDMPTA